MIAAVFLLGRTLPTAWAGTGSSRRVNLENWFAVSNSRTFGIPFFTAAFLCLIAKVAGGELMIAKLFANAFVMFIFLALFLTAGRVAHVRLGIKLIFMTIFFGALISMLLLGSENSLSTASYKQSACPKSYFLVRQDRP